MCFVDKNYKLIKQLHGVQLCNPKCLITTTDEYDFIIIASLLEADEIMNLLRQSVPMFKVVNLFSRRRYEHFASGAEDFIVRTIFRFMGKEQFSYIDIGANDPYK